MTLSWSAVCDCGLLLSYSLTSLQIFRAALKSRTSSSLDIKYIQTDFALQNRVIIKSYEPVHEISNNVVCATSKASDRPAHTRNLIIAFASRLSILYLLSY